jgi:uncharacterized protein YciI
MFLCILNDKPGSNALRMATRPDHLKYLDTVRSSVVIGGPQLSEDGQTMIGTYFVIDVADRAAAEEQIRNDPYTKAGLFESTVIRPCRKAMP